ncbi:hypothetical protein Xen7305DRAFT_00014150 [Xenococcus sp. PCC 7305]|uniref:hypothetical protein n=1 Tax=Xenococcus sp. PCC 7305 TaxID=102125 RepID=UPI0002ABD6EE|nr:hypothetical protein [Xenococcus sp. PCC 7305]ELS01710.1 hypothetical protein Xen7305DRAFT_00014150 [Xenococcus sp. PCC 7305]
MVEHLYGNFLSNLEEYEKSEIFWRDLCDSLINNLLTEQTWTIWLNTYYVDGTPFLDGSPIYSLISSNRKKGIAIYQDQPTTNNIKISAYMEVFGAITVNNDSVEELVITCELSKEAALIAQQLIQEWIKDTTSYQDMERIIEQMIDKYY